jgi:hypothetical protein
MAICEAQAAVERDAMNPAPHLRAAQLVMEWRAAAARACS